jgi:hypothetical protein
MDHIITAKDITERDGALNLHEWIMRLVSLRGFTIRSSVEGNAVTARIDAGRWIADCECGGAEYVDPGEPIFFCFSCGNAGNKSSLRPVAFPRTRVAIENALLVRPVTLRGGKGMIEQAMRAAPAGLPRSWSPGISAKHLATANASAGLEVR